MTQESLEGDSREASVFQRRWIFHNTQRMFLIIGALRDDLLSFSCKKIVQTCCNSLALHDIHHSFEEKVTVFLCGGFLNCNFRFLTDTND